MSCLQGSLLEKTRGSPHLLRLCLHWCCCLLLGGWLWEAEQLLNAAVVGLYRFLAAAAHRSPHWVTLWKRDKVFRSVQTGCRDSWKLPLPGARWAASRDTLQNVNEIKRDILGLDKWSLLRRDKCHRWDPKALVREGSTGNTGAVQPHPSL